MSEGTETTTSAEPAAAVLDTSEINYEQPNLARTGTPATEDGQAPGAVETDTTETIETTETTERVDEKRPRTLVGDLQAERGKRQEAERQLAEERRIIDSWKPILQRLEGRPDLQQAVLNGNVTIAQAEAAKDRDDQAELKDIAEDLGYLEGDGVSPDLKRAERYRERHLKWARQTAEPLVQPLAQQSLERRVAARIEQAVQYAKDQGDADPDFVREELTEAARKNPQWVLDNEAGNLLYSKAAHRTVREKRTRTAPTVTPRAPREDREFVHTEAPGGRRTGPNLTTAERDLGAQYGLTDKDWALAEQHAGVRRGYTRLTED